MNNYFALRKANCLRMQFVSGKSRAQIKEVIQYLRRVSWDLCGIELVRSDLIDMAIQANKEGQELFNVITDAETFVQEVKPSLRVLNWFDFLTIAIPLFCFLGLGLEGLLLYPVIPEFHFEVTVGYLIQFGISTLSAYYLFRRMMERVGFPPCKNRLKYALYLVFYVAALYGTGQLLYATLGKFVLVSIPMLNLAVAGLLTGALLLWVRFYWYGKDARLKTRV